MKATGWIAMKRGCRSVVLKTWNKHPRWEKASALFVFIHFPASSMRLILWMPSYICLKSNQMMSAEAALNAGHCCMYACSVLSMSHRGCLPKLCSSGPRRGMAQMRKLACDGIRANSRGEPQVPLVSARQEILTSLVSALDSVVRPRSSLEMSFRFGDLILRSQGD